MATPARIRAVTAGSTPGRLEPANGATIRSVMTLSGFRHQAVLRLTATVGSAVVAIALPASALPTGDHAGTSQPSPTRSAHMSANWPCVGCLVVLPRGYDASRPAALVVALHGDEGTPGLIAATLSRVTTSRNVILFAPQCPTSAGCRLPNGTGSTNSWWGWLQFSPTYNDGWLGRQISRVEARYAINRSQEYAFGWSGGADYLGWYALRDGARFAGVAFVAGGIPYLQSCPSTRLAAFFILGAADPRYQSGQPSQVKAVFDRCGDKTKLVLLPGADHAGTTAALESRAFAGGVLDWLMHQRRAAKAPS
jgi:poly(3-hydroxybutyrate) depolymerase